MNAKSEWLLHAPSALAAYELPAARTSTPAPKPPDGACARVRPGGVIDTPNRNPIEYFNVIALGSMGPRNYWSRQRPLLSVLTAFACFRLYQRGFAGAGGLLADEMALPVWDK